MDISRMSFRDLADHYLLVKNIDAKTMMTIKASGFPIEQSCNAMLVYGYIDHVAGLSFELLCAARVMENTEVVLEQTNMTTAMKFRFGAFKGDVTIFDYDRRVDEYSNRVYDFEKYYGVNDEVRALRDVTELDESRAPGYPDDYLVIFLLEGRQNEGIWCRAEGLEVDNYILIGRMLNEPNADIGIHGGDLIKAKMVPIDGTIRLVAEL